MKSLLILHPNDSVAVALRPLKPGPYEIDGISIVLDQPVPVGHKVALRKHAADDLVIKFGHPIGCATTSIRAGEWVHTHNLVSNISERGQYHYSPNLVAPPNRTPLPAFMGFKRKGKRVGTRNEIWIVPTVNCVNGIAQKLAEMGRRKFVGEGLEGVHAFPHPFGCSQLGMDLARTGAVLEGLVRHPNVGGVLILGLGCENLRLKPFVENIWGQDSARIRFLEAQSVDDEIAVGMACLEELAAQARKDRREPCPVSDLVLGMKCGGSDSHSGITANPLVGRVTDRLSNLGGRVLLTEVPEMFGAEQILMNRAANPDVYQDLVQMIQQFKDYFVRHHQPVFENPSPGNKEGGISTLEEKSLGAIQKGGQAAVCSVLNYGEPAVAKGLSLVNAPGNDGVSATALVVSGATLLLFTTGRGTPMGFPVPTIKLASNADLAKRKPQWIDFDASVVLEEGFDSAESKLLQTILDIASGRPACSEQNNQREIVIWKDGVTL